MHRCVDELLHLLDQHLGQYKQLADLLETEQDALIALDLERIQETIKAKEVLCLKIKLLVPGLAQGIKDAARALGVAEEPMPVLADLAKAASEPWSSRLYRAGEMLARYKTDIARRNDKNRNFVQDALEVFSESVAILTGAALVPKDQYRPYEQGSTVANHAPMKLSREV